MNDKEFIEVLETRFKSNMHLHEGLKWEDVEPRLNDQVLSSLMYMEESGGCPDVIKYDQVLDQYHYCDTVDEVPEDRANTTYDQKGQDLRKNLKDVVIGNAVSIAEAHHAALLSELEYEYLQSLGDFDLKTSVWLQTPDEVRALGGALFGDKRYGRHFVYHNGAQSFYKSRRFRLILKI